jgi:hypothetical protein
MRFQRRGGGETFVAICSVIGRPPQCLDWALTCSGY